LDFVSSDETLDRYDEIISAYGWKLDTYKKNPVFQNAHQYGDILFTLGKALVTEVRAGKLVQRIQFATDVNPMAKIAYGFYKGKFLNAVSVGFIPLRWQDGDGGTENEVGRGGGGPLGLTAPAALDPRPSTLSLDEGCLSLDTRHPTLGTRSFRRRYL